jgi:uncharacterized protein YdhG (YjbR/CyaY superfamily)
MKTYKTVDEYIEGFPPDIQKKLYAIRAVVLHNAPHAQERLSYGMPSLYLNGSLVYYAAFLNHISFFPTAEGVNAFREELEAFHPSKGTVRIPLDAPLPLELIGRITQERVRQQEAKQKKK